MWPILRKHAATWDYITGGSIIRQIKYFLPEIWFCKEGADCCNKIWHGCGLLQTNHDFLYHISTMHYLEKKFITDCYCIIMFRKRLQLLNKLYIDMFDMSVLPVCISKSPILQFSMHGWIWNVWWIHHTAVVDRFYFLSDLHHIHQMWLQLKIQNKKIHVQIK